MRFLVCTYLGINMAWLWNWGKKNRSGGRGYQSVDEAAGCSNGWKRGKGSRINKNNLLESEVMKYNKPRLAPPGLRGSWCSSLPEKPEIQPSKWVCPDLDFSTIHVLVLYHCNRYSVKRARGERCVQEGLDWVVMRTWAGFPESMWLYVTIAWTGSECL